MLFIVKKNGKRALVRLTLQRPARTVAQPRILHFLPDTPEEDERLRQEYKEKGWYLR